MTNDFRFLPSIFLLSLAWSLISAVVRTAKYPELHPESLLAPFQICFEPLALFFGVWRPGWMSDWSRCLRLKVTFGKTSYLLWAIKSRFKEIPSACRSGTEDRVPGQERSWLVHFMFLTHLTQHSYPSFCLFDYRAQPLLLIISLFGDRQDPKRRFWFATFSEPKIAAALHLSVARYLWWAIVGRRWSRESNLLSGLFHFYDDPSDSLQSACEPRMGFLCFEGNSFNFLLLVCDLRTLRVVFHLL